MCLDLDRFKEANDTYGHLVGDSLLREAARRLQAATEGAFLARIGGDEFIVVLSGEDPDAAAATVGERMPARRIAMRRWRFSKRRSPPRVGRVMRSKRDCFLVGVWKE